MKLPSFGPIVILVSASLALPLSGCSVEEDALAELLDDLDRDTTLTTCLLAQQSAGYTTAAETAVGKLWTKGPGATRIARGAVERVIWFPPRGVSLTSEIVATSVNGVLEVAGLGPRCTSEGESSQDEVASFELELRAASIGADEVALRVDGASPDQVELEVAECVGLTIESEPLAPRQGEESTPERRSTVCARLIDADGAPLYAADSIEWRVVVGEGPLLSPLEGPADSGPCIVVSSTSEEPIVVAATFLDFVATVTADLSDAPSP